MGVPHARSMRQAQRSGAQRQNECQRLLHQHSALGRLRSGIIRLRSLLIFVHSTFLAHSTCSACSRCCRCAMPSPSPSPSSSLPTPTSTGSIDTGWRLRLLSLPMPGRRSMTRPLGRPRSEVATAGARSASSTAAASISSASSVTFTTAGFAGARGLAQSSAAIVIKRSASEWRQHACCPQIGSRARAFLRPSNPIGNSH